MSLILIIFCEKLSALFRRFFLPDFISPQLAANLALFVFSSYSASNCSYITDSDEQGEAITITAVAAGQDGQEIVLPADIVVAHQLIAVQQSNMDV